MDSQWWDERYSQPGLAYGDDPNDFLASVADRIPQVERAADVERVFSLMGGYLTSGDSADPGSLSDN